MAIVNIDLDGINFVWNRQEKTTEDFTQTQKTPHEPPPEKEATHEEKKRAEFWKSNPQTHNTLLQRKAAQYLNSPQKQRALSQIKKWMENDTWTQIALGQHSPWAKIQPLLQKFGSDIKIAKNSLQAEKILPPLLRFTDDRWASLHTHKEIEEMMTEELERAVFTHPKVAQALQKKRNNSQFRQELEKHLSPKDLALLTAVMLTEIPTELPEERRVEAHSEILRIFAKMLEKSKDLSIKLLESNSKVILVPKTKSLNTSCEEHQPRRCIPVEDGIRGVYYEGTNHVYIGEENLFGHLKDGRAHDTGKSIAVHELAHLIDFVALPRNIRSKIRSIYNKKIGLPSKQHWNFSKGAYASTNAEEYFAEFAAYYFEANGHVKNKTVVVGKDNLHKLNDTERETYKLFQNIFGDGTKIHYTNPLARSII